MRVIDLENINEAMRNETQFVFRCEEVYHDKISAAAAAILASRSERPVVALTGPSGSGKTTTAMRLKEYLENLSVKVCLLHMDNFFTPLNLRPKELTDWESPLCVNIDGLVSTVGQLMDGREVEVPVYEFKTGEIGGYTKMVQNDTFIREFGLYDKLFTPTVMSRRCGNTVAFLMEMEYLIVEKPAGYSASKEADKYQQAAGDDALQAALADPESVNRPNIIVIMNEAFSDLSVLGELVTNEDYMPFIRSLQQGAENTVTGYANVSVLGGNTANSEFEFLTGGSMAFLPQGSVVYQQYLKQEMPNLVSYLKDLGYSTVAMHPYNASGWERDRVYPMMGFDEFISLKNFGMARRLRKYVTDEACYDRIIDLYEKKDENEPLFVFNVTMQNHSSYTEQFDNFTPGIEAEGINSDALNMYLSLMKESDRAFEELVNYFAEAEEDTIILFFGDHQPTSYVSNPVFRANGIDPNNLTDEQNMLKYKVPYVLWSNFDMKGDVAEATGSQGISVAGETSLNYLALDVLEASGLPLPASMNSLEEVRGEYPVVTAIGVVDKEGNLLEAKECAEGLRAYQSQLYYLLFDYEE